MTPTRRAFLGAGLTAAAWTLARARAEAAAPEKDGFRLFEAAPSRLELAPPPADPAMTLSYAGETPGPLLRLKRGEEVRLRLVNRLSEPTTLSFPGLRGANGSAGLGGLTGPRIAPGGSADIRLVPPDSGFNVYLPHCGGSDAAQQGRGLFGPIVVEEAEKLDADEDFVVVLSDWSLDDKGQIRDDFSDPALARGAGRKGGLVFANGGAAPLMLKARPGARVRLRLGNAATARLTNVAIDGAKALIVAVDGQPSEPFEPLRNQFPMGPGARFELMFELPRDAGPAVRFVLRSDGAPDLPFVTIAAEGEPVAERSLPPRLPANPALPTEIALEAARSFTFAVTGGGAAPFALNGVTFTDWAPKPAAAIARGAPTVFAFANKTGVVQAMRLGGHVGRLLHSMDDGWEPYWRDTILIQPGRTLHVAFVADNPGKWPIESAIPEHRAAGVGAWFQVG
ncbi:MAG: multicopper oxidase family protein [Hyphomicrobiales bacterium]|nr:multicopper oxidase family protein [Hyphomicrobiales bacterium]